MTNSVIHIIGGGPAGLMAAEVLAHVGHSVTVYERKPSIGRKFLMAGRGGLNLTHSEALPGFLRKYGPAQSWLMPIIEKFTPDNLRDWSNDLGQETFIGTSGRVFPAALKTSPLLRAWKERLEGMGIRIMTHHDWQGWENGDLVFKDAHDAVKKVRPDTTLLALGGASWPKLGSDGGWAPLLQKQGIDIAPLQAANCGFMTAWSDIFREKFSGTPLKSITVSFGGQTLPGEAMMTTQGIEGGVIYALSSALRDEINKNSRATFYIDLKPGLSLQDLTRKLKTPRRTESFSNYLRKEISLPPVAIGLLREGGRSKDLPSLTPENLAALIKSVPVETSGTAAIDRAISTAGGIRLTELDDNLMLKKMPGVFVAGEMLDWEAPTGGYLLQAVFSTAVKAAEGMILWLKNQKL
jgi:uncharacterized flavoprotein (TIGR03862 family)